MTKSKQLKFPKNFLWGSSVSAYQVEGGIENCDWSEKFPAGQACDYYNQYEHYFDLAKELNQNVHRFSLEWSRIEPEEGKFDRKEIEHYKKVLLALKKRNIKSMVTIWHYTLPLWLSRKGGWHNPKAPQYFESYAKFVAEELDDLVDFWVTLNEPMVYMSLAYIIGRFPPQKKNSFLVPAIFFNFINAHKKAYKAIHSVNKNAKVGIAENHSFVEPYNKKSFLNKVVASVWNFLENRLFLTLTKNYHDYLGVNYYFHDRVRIMPLSFPPARIENENKKISDMGWEIYPEGIYHILMGLKKYNLPIYITENGIADAKDKRKAKFIADHLKWTHKAISEGADIRGYMYWSLLDNFEWDSGFAKRFGLIEINYEKMETKIRGSAREYAEVCEKNSLS